MSGTTPVATWLLNNYTTQDPASYKAALDGNASVAQRIVDAFAPRQKSTPAMKVTLDAGYVFNGITLTEVASQDTGTITAPSTHNRIDRIVIDRFTGAVSVITGAENVSPVPPAITAGKVPVAQVLLTTATTTIVNAAITDERSLAALGRRSPTVQYLTSGSGATYNTPAGCTWIKVKMYGGAGGGGGNGTSGATNGGVGGDTIFNSIHAKGGSGGVATNSTAGAAGGAGGSAGTGSAGLRISGAAGSNTLAVNAAYGTALGGFGGTSPLGGAGPSNAAASTNSASGGGGASSVSASFSGGAGGGAGEYAELVIDLPASTYTYTIGAAGTAGGAGTGGGVGFAGGTGLIIIVDPGNWTTS